MIHELKTWPECFWDIVNRRKTFEVRKNDRNFRIGDRLELLEFDPETNKYTGFMAVVHVVFACALPLLDEYIGMSIEFGYVCRLPSVQRLQDQLKKDEVIE